MNHEDTKSTKMGREVIHSSSPYAFVLFVSSWLTLSEDHE
jgi:hypothetical protein